MRRLPGILVLLLLPLLSASAADFTAVDGEVRRLMESGAVPGAALVVVRDGQVVHTRTFGTASVESGATVSADTLFRIGSTTKMFVAAAAVRLADEKKLRLDQPIGELVPDLPLPLRALTMDQLLSHTAGLRDDAPMTGPLDEKALGERVKSWGETAFFTEPGEIFSYSNPGYVLAGYVVERVSGTPFSDAVAKLVLLPAGMKSSTFRPLAAMTYPIALGHERSAEGPRVIRPFAEHAGAYPSGSLFTSAADMGRFMVSVLAGDQPMAARLGETRAAIPAGTNSYGYGLVVREDEGRKVLMHTGARSGYGSIVAFLPEDRIGIAILTNRTGAIFTSAAAAAIHVLTGRAPAPARAGQHAPQPVSPEEAAGLAGTYINSDIVRALLELRDGTLQLKIGNRSFPVMKVGEGRYAAAGAPHLDRFVVVADGKGSARYIASDMHALRKRRDE